MPRLLIHAIIGIPLSFLIAFIFDPLAGLVFFLSSLLVDIDHLVGYYFITRDWTWNVRTEYERMSKWWMKVRAGELDIKHAHLHFLHRIEVWVVVACFAPIPFSMIGIGALSNILLDLIEWPERIKYMSLAADIVEPLHRTGDKI